MAYELPGRKLKLGHGGTLDMYATGVMCIGLGAACKQLHALLHGKKVLGIENSIPIKQYSPITRTLYYCNVSIPIIEINSVIRQEAYFKYAKYLIQLFIFLNNLHLRYMAIAFSGRCSVLYSILLR